MFRLCARGNGDTAKVNCFSKVAHHQAPPRDSAVDVQQGAVILFEDFCRPQTAVDVRPLILAQVEQPARLLT